MPHLDTEKEDPSSEIKGASPEMADIKAKEPFNNKHVADKVAAAMSSEPPVISEKAEEKTAGIEIYIPLGGDDWKRISLETGLKTTKQMKDRLRAIAEEENLDIKIEYDPAGMGDMVKISRKKGVKYAKTVSPENIAFIKCFEYDAVPHGE